MSTFSTSKYVPRYNAIVRMVTHHSLGLFEFSISFSVSLSFSALDIRWDHLACVKCSLDHDIHSQSNGISVGILTLILFCGLTASSLGLPKFSQLYFADVTEDRLTGIVIVQWKVPFSLEGKRFKLWFSRLPFDFCTRKQRHDFLRYD